MLGHSLYARPARWLAGATALVVGTLLGLGACQKKDSNPAPTPTPAATPSIQLLPDAAVGPHLADSLGNTIYYFSRDLAGDNNCTGGCASTWPVFYSAHVVVGNGLDAKDFATITTSTGQRQTTYKGWPMYYYAPADANGQFTREKPGQVTGNNVGGVWYTMRPDYTLLLARATVTNQTTNVGTAKSFLIDSQGRTLYTFAKDQTSPSTQPTNCTGGCATVWPVYGDAPTAVPSSLKLSDFGSITRADGADGYSRQQTTYKGLPLYYYAPDNSTRNKVGGDGVGNVWMVAAP